MNRIACMLLIASLVVLGGCEAIKGLGKDFQKAGKWIEKSAAGKGRGGPAQAEAGRQNPWKPIGT